MPKFSAKSLERLHTCEPALQELFNAVIEVRDCSILCGHRGKEDQDKACAAGKSQAPWPTSRHNCTPSAAVDVAPYPLDWNDIESFKEFGALVKEFAEARGIKIRWGGDFKSFKDYPHFELVEEKPDGEA